MTKERRKAVFRFVSVFLTLPICLSGAGESLDYEEVLRRAGKKLTEKDTMILVESKSGLVKGIVNRDIAFSKLAKPGSTFKLISAYSILEKNMNHREERIYCDDKFFIVGEGTRARRVEFSIRNPRIGDYFRCSKYGGHGTVGLAQAIRRSCNHYFFNMSDVLSYDELLISVRRFGFDKKVFQEEDGPAGKIVRCDNRKDRVLSYIGEGDSFRVSPMNMALFFHFLASEGRGKRLYYQREGQVLASSMPGMKSVCVECMQFIKKSLSAKVSTGAESGQRVLVRSFAGKTGTVSNRNSTLSSGWYAGYAPVKKAEFSFVLYLQKGNGKDAYRMMKQVLFGEK
ncbi:MAG: penicillin-binding transpeptidase domain-containing protein [Spirochaetota bacterium]|nr:penicillin-binding transpeptidase domain-containing protein [Spirochaetota bacterium]